MPATLDQRDLKRRHPLCPACGYDLVASIAANKRVCPECGEEFALDELNWEKRRGDWNLGTALLLGGRALGLRSVISFPVVIALASLALLSVVWGVPRIVPFLLAITQACLIGWIFSRRLVDDAGFESMLLIIAACFAATIVSAVGFVVAARWLVGVPGGGLGFLHNLVCIFGSCIWIIYQLV